MKDNIRVSAFLNRNQRGDGRTRLFFTIVVSFICHMIFFAVVVFSPSLKTETKPSRSVINVSMVSFKEPLAPMTEKPAVEKTPSRIEKPKVVEPLKPVSSAKKKTATIVKPKPKPKTSLKKKTFKSTQAVKQAMKKLKNEEKTPEKNVQQETLKSALDRLKEEVKKTEATRSTTSGKKAGPFDKKSGAGSGRFNEKGRKIAELVDLYRLEIAFQIQKKWAFNEQLAGGDQSLMTAIVFKVMPDGEIRDVFFTDRSGNSYLDDSAYRAIMKSNPVDSHPSVLSQPYVEMGIRFTPQGIR